MVRGNWVRSTAHEQCHTDEIGLDCAWDEESEGGGGEGGGKDAHMRMHTHPRTPPQTVCACARGGEEVDEKDKRRVGVGGPRQHLILPIPFHHGCS
jgi:hypothetical protein